MLNKVILTGRLTKTIDIRKTTSGKSVASFSLAVERKIKDQSGNRMTDFHDCVVWGALAENLANWTEKGSLIGVTGRLEKRSYQNQQGQQVVVTEVVVEEFSLLEFKKQGTKNRTSLPQDTTTSEQTSFFQGNTTNLVD
ncbi:single-stranded DNA-binding protein [Streptococcus suis]